MAPLKGNPNNFSQSCRLCRLSFIVCSFLFPSFVHTLPIAFENEITLLRSYPTKTNAPGNKHRASSTTRLCNSSHVVALMGVPLRADKNFSYSFLFSFFFARATKDDSDRHLA